MKVVIDDCRLERMDAYTDPLNDKIKRQAAEITRLLAENAELKKDLEYYHTGTDTCDIESARATGQRESWELALKLRYMDYEDKVECFGLGYDGKEKWVEIMEKYTYAEAAAKVAEWKKAKEEICVGDVLLSKTIREKCIVTSFSKSENTTYILWNDCSYGRRATNKLKEEFEKIGHIDVDAWLAQIGGGSDETEN